MYEYAGLRNALETAEAVIFDLDNTILDSHLAWRAVDRCFFEKRGLAEPEDYGRAVSCMTLREAAVYSAGLLKLDESVDDIIKEWLSLIYEQYAKELRLFEGAAELIRRLSGCGRKIGLATASSEELYTAALGNNNVLDCFSAFATTNETERGKGFPDVYLLAAERLGAKPEDCLVFEDILIGITAAKSVGMKTAAFLNPFAEDEHDKLAAEADHSFYSYVDLL